jgi:hypothetical protein
MTDTSTKVREHYSAMELTGRIKSDCLAERLEVFVARDSDFEAVGVESR